MNNIKSEDLPIDMRNSLPDNPALNSLISILDCLDNQSVLIMDCTSCVRFFNNAYLRAYGHAFSSVGISPDQILKVCFTKLSEAIETWAIFNHIIATGVPRKNYYFDLPDVHRGFADLIPIRTGEFLGIAVIIQEHDKLQTLLEQIDYYKRLSQNLKRELDDKQNLPIYFKQIIGKSESFIRVLQMAAKVAPTKSSVCILGESGTGKEVLAEAIHYSSKYVEGPIVKINCAAIPESLMESELFGYEKGAFTGAKANGNPGKFELANNGTIFLDEIGDMPLSMQAKLLRILEERKVTRIGGQKPKKINFRLITATNRNLEQMVKDGSFREDLYYRISIIPLYLPPLRKRRSDIPLLSKEFLSALNMPQWKNRRFSKQVLKQFMNYNWPGNIRELKNCVERMAVLCPDEEIGMEYLPAAIADAPNTLPGSAKSSPVDLSQYNLHNILANVERNTISAVLDITGGNKAKAIKILKISKRNFYIKLDKYNLR